MAKQQKKGARKAPRATEPRMYGDGQPSESTQSQPTAQPSAAATPKAAPATRTTGTRSAGVTPRGGAGATGAYTRVDRITDYSYVVHDLRRLGIVAASIIAGLIVLGIIVK